LGNTLAIFRSREDDVGEIKVSRWECDTCHRMYKTKKEYQECISNHKSEEAIVTVGKIVTVGIPRTGQGYMGGPIEFEGYDWTIGKIVSSRMNGDDPEALIELDGERNWVSGHTLLDWDRQKTSEEYRKSHPIDYSGISCQTIIIGRG
jgi:hypothetical protein